MGERGTVNVINDGMGVFVLGVDFKYKQPSCSIVDSIFKHRHSLKPAVIDFVGDWGHSTTSHNNPVLSPSEVDIG